MDKVFKGLFDTDLTAVIKPLDFMLCLGVSLVLGIMLALSYVYKSRYTKSFVLTLSMLPAVVCVVIMMVNGNIGAGVAVAGAFSLVRFRSVPGSAKEICMLFLAMGAGLIAGMGYLAYATLFTLIMCVVFFIYSHLDLGSSRLLKTYKTLTVTIPEDLNYSGVFEEIFKEYTTSVSLIRVKSVNMGSMFKLTYDVSLIEGCDEKELLDKLRERNGNLEVSLAVRDNSAVEL